MRPDSRVHLEVAAGVIWNAEGDRVLIARRPEGVHQGGLWEFPGGKIETGESVQDALTRELREEIGIGVRSASPLITLLHDYPDRSVRLHILEVRDFSGEPLGAEGQPVRWVAPNDLDAYPFPAANDPIRRAVQLPAWYPILDIDEHPPERLISTLRAWSTGGVRLLRFRTASEKTDRCDLEGLLREANALGMAVMADTAGCLRGIRDAQGLHLRSWELPSCTHRPVSKEQWLAASCHDEEDLAHAARIGVDFAVLGPVFSTASHPGAPFLGWAAFHRLMEPVSFPVYALGGVGLHQVETARGHGAQGISGIRTFLCELPSEGA